MKKDNDVEQEVDNIEELIKNSFGDGERLLNILMDKRYRYIGGVTDKHWFCKWIEFSGRESMNQLAERLFWEWFNYKVDNKLPKTVTDVANEEPDRAIHRLYEHILKAKAKRQWDNQLAKLRQLDSEAVRGTDFAQSKQRIWVINDLIKRGLGKMIESGNYDYRMLKEIRGLMDDIARETGGRIPPKQLQDREDIANSKPLTLAEVIQIMQEQSVAVTKPYDIDIVPLEITGRKKA
jgi:hypothetical protein